MLRKLYVAFRRRQLYRRAVGASGRVVILRYHSVGEPEDVDAYLDPGLSLSPARFRAQLEALARHTDVITPDALPERLRTPGDRLATLITFDDGYRDNHDVALPILGAVGVPATFYVTTGPLESGQGLWISELWRLARLLPPGAPLGLDPALPDTVPETAAEREQLRRKITRHFAGLSATAREQALDRLATLCERARGEGLAESFLTPDHVSELARAGMTIGAHTRTHPHLDRLDPALHAEEVEGAKADLEALLGAPVEHFAYPNPSGGGRWGAEARASAEAAGFRTAMTSTPAPLQPDADLLRLPRLGVYGRAQSELLFRQLARAAS